MLEKYYLEFDYINVKFYMVKWANPSLGGTTKNHLKE
jgi:hypothetical protein